MRRIVKDFVTPPARLISPNCQEKIKEAIISQEGHKFSTYYYRDSCISELELIYHCKCAFCETNTLAGASFRVDHFRPKCNVKDDAQSKGYYWLGYEWSNLILICEKCNLSKSNKFPIDGTRIYHPLFSAANKVNDSCRLITGAMLIAEYPRLLNPEVDDVEAHFGFDPDGSIIGVTDRGKATIEVCDLNREALKLDRKKIIDGLFSRLQEILLELFESRSFDNVRFSFKLFFKDLEKLNVANMKYSLLGQNIIDHFPRFFIDPLPPKQKQAAGKVYGLYAAGKL
ncbi:hypothetical protein [Chitinophaga sp. Cy-1792]|uniref:hypothetical protein n=1 Tax=Chitinophaga sp. Cy-1792 TaxID=2608339 RepID=UPI0014248BFC|nr:hypothetical protein [Chitinophaga sp. Cy-1792]NIG54863.1 hypothetical protein [Chitinophaga sp. Cy-1792]